MNKLWQVIGKIVFYAGWPVLYLYLGRSVRTRVLIFDEHSRLLILQSWLSVGKWGLPGGGLHNNEDPKIGAIREVLEETGIKLSANQLEELGYHKSIREKGLSFHYWGFAVHLTRNYDLVLQPMEISEAQWVSPKRALSSDLLDLTSKDLLRSWSEQK